MNHHANYSKYHIWIWQRQKKHQSRKKNTIYVQEYKKIVAKMEAEILTKKDKMREKLKRIELMSVYEDNNTVTMTHKNKADRSEYDNTLKALENIQVLLNKHSNEKFQISYQLV